MLGMIAACLFLLSCVIAIGFITFNYPTSKSGIIATELSDNEPAAV